MTTPGLPAHRRDVEQKRQRHRDKNDERELRSHGDGQRDSQQDDTAPVPQDDFARRVERVRDGDGREDGAEGSPCGDDFGFGVPDRGGLNQRRGETVEGEGDEASGIAAKAAGNVPQRRAQKNATSEKWNAGEPAPVGGGFAGEVAVAKPAGARRKQGRAAANARHRNRRRRCGTGLRGNACRSIQKGRAGDAAAMPLLPSFADANALPDLGFMRGSAVRNGPATGPARGRPAAGIPPGIADGRSVRE